MGFENAPRRLRLRQCSNRTRTAPTYLSDLSWVRGDLLT